MEELEDLENRLFMLKMQDSWTSEDYKYANELKEKIKEAKNGRK